MRLIVKYLFPMLVLCILLVACSAGNRDPYSTYDIFPVWTNNTTRFAEDRPRPINFGLYIFWIPSVPVQVVEAKRAHTHLIDDDWIPAFLAPELELSIELTLPVKAEWSLTIHRESDGKTVWQSGGMSEAGSIDRVWDGRDMNGYLVSPGVYVLSARAADYRSVPIHLWVGFD